LHEFESKGDLDRYFAGHNGILVGASGEALRKYYALDVTDKNGGQMTVGILSSHHGIRPSWTFSEDGNVLALGHDLTVTFVDIANRCLRASQRLEGVFFEFINQSDHNYVIALHELGVANFDFSGRKLWSISTPDVAESAEMRNDETLVVRHQGPGKQLVVDVLSGRVRPLG